VPRRILNLMLQSDTTATSRDVAIDDAVVAGWTGRDAAAVEKHIRELEALGVKRPASTPIFYRVSAARLTTGDEIEVVGEKSGGEVEFVLLQHGGRMWVGTGSDHTDREVETYGVTVSKQMCDKPVAPVLWEIEDVLGHWDQMILRSFAWINGKRELYQEGTLDAMLPVDELIKGGFEDGKLPDGCAMFGGTFAAKGGIRPADRFEYELEDPVLKRTIRHAYDVITLPMRG
jgi:hypothetical protein